MCQSLQQSSRITSNTKDMDQWTCIMEFFGVTMWDRRLTIARDELVISSTLSDWDWLITYSLWLSTYVSTMNPRAHVTWPIDHDGTSTAGITTASVGNGTLWNAGHMAWCAEINGANLGTLPEPIVINKSKSANDNNKRIFALLCFFELGDMASCMPAWCAWGCLLGWCAHLMLLFLHIDFIWENE